MIISFSEAQDDFGCFTPYNFLTLKSGTCSDWNIYDPVDPFDTPIKTIRITFHIIQKNNGSGNFPENTASRDWLEDTLMVMVNSTYANFQEMNLPTSSPIITDSRVRFSLANIYFWQDDYGWSYQQTEDFGNYLYNKFVVNQSNVLNKDNSVHIFLSENAVCLGRASDIGDKRWITTAGIYFRYQQHYWAPGKNLYHELGHSLGLNHTWFGDECDDTPNNPNCWNINEPCCKPYWASGLVGILNHWSISNTYLNRSLTINEIQNDLQNNRPFIIHLFNSDGSGGHTVVGYGFDDNDVFIQNPGNGSQIRDYYDLTQGTIQVWEETNRITTSATDCILVQNVIGTLNGANSVYKAENLINASCIINNNSTIEFQCENDVILQEGFEIQLGSSLSIETGINLICS